MANTAHVTPARQIHRAGGTAALVRRVVEEAGNDGDLTVLDDLPLAPAVTMVPACCTRAMQAEGPAP